VTMATFPESSTARTLPKRAPGVPPPDAGPVRGTAQPSVGSSCASVRLPA
jgi:hypothetical protein